jgi:hypothetical protein
MRGGGGSRGSGGKKGKGGIHGVAAPVNTPGSYILNDNSVGTGSMVCCIHHFIIFGLIRTRSPLKHTRIRNPRR